jgi:glycosyltransferase involved in cell wall biosynthesis
MDQPLARLLEHSGCSVDRDVPDMLPFLREARVLVVPLHVGGGSRVKIVEAWAAGTPVVSTTVGAAGLECAPGSDIVIADTAGEFAMRVRDVATDDALHERLRTAGLKRAARLRWSRMRTTIESIYAAELARPPSGDGPLVSGPMRSACE